jgi:hypothetical protein
MAPLPVLTRLPVRGLQSASANARPKKEAPLAAGLIGRLLVIGGVFPLFSLLSDAVFDTPLENRRSKCCARRLLPGKSGGRRRGARNVRVWAICHVVKSGPAVKIFDAWSAHRRDISAESGEKTSCGTTIWT